MEVDIVWELVEFVCLGGRVVVFGFEGEGEWYIEIDNWFGVEVFGWWMVVFGYCFVIVIGVVEGVCILDDCFVGFCIGFEVVGGMVVVVWCGDFCCELGVVVMMDVLVDGVFVGILVFVISDVFVIGVMFVICDVGCEVGFDIVVCGFDDVFFSCDVLLVLMMVCVLLSEVGY